MTAAHDLTDTDTFNPDGGFTISWRRKWDNPIFRNKQEAAVWVWMCDKAQWEPCRYRSQFGPISLERGELVIAERELAEDFGMHRNTLRTLIQRLVDDGMITLIRDRIPRRAGTIVRIEKYEEYQSFTNVRRWLQDRKNNEVRTEAGPNVDRNRTESKEVNKPKEDRTLVASDDATPSMFELQASDSEPAAKPKAGEHHPKFEEFWQAYPRRASGEGKYEAGGLFTAAVKRGIDPDYLIECASAYRQCMILDGSTSDTKEGRTNMVMQARRFLCISKRNWEEWPDKLRDRQSSNVHRLRPTNSRNGYDQPRRQRARGYEG